MRKILSKSQRSKSFPDLFSPHGACKTCKACFVFILPTLCKLNICIKMWLILLSLIFVGLLLYRLFVFKIPHGMPPGPIFGVPLLGTGIHLGENPLPGVKNLRKK